jgi:hypothetical protein
MVDPAGGVLPGRLRDDDAGCKTADLRPTFPTFARAKPWHENAL